MFSLLRTFIIVFVFLELFNFVNVSIAFDSSIFNPFKSVKMQSVKNKQQQTKKTITKKIALPPKKNKIVKTKTWQIPSLTENMFTVLGQLKEKTYIVKRNSITKGNSNIFLWNEGQIINNCYMEQGGHIVCFRPKIQIKNDNEKITEIPLELFLKKED